MSAFSRRRWTPSGPRPRLLVSDDRSVSLPSEMHWLVTRRLKSRGDANQYPAPGVPFMMLQGERKQSKRGGKSKIKNNTRKKYHFFMVFPYTKQIQTNNGKNFLFGSFESKPNEEEEKSRRRGRFSLDVFFSLFISRKPSYYLSAFFFFFNDWGGIGNFLCIWSSFLFLGK